MHPDSLQTLLTASWGYQCSCSIWSMKVRWLGKRSIVDMKKMVNSSIQVDVAKHGFGRRNKLHLMAANGLFATNTSFSHSSRHITTRTGLIRDQSTRKSKPYFSQILKKINRYNEIVLHTHNQFIISSNIYSLNNHFTKVVLL